MDDDAEEADDEGKSHSAIESEKASEESAISSQVAGVKSLLFVGSGKNQCGTFSAASQDTIIIN